MENIKNQLIEKTKLLKKYSINLPWLESKLLLSNVLKKDLNWIFFNLNKRISKKYIKTYDELIKKRTKKIPIAYLIKRKAFWDYDFKVNKNTLIPRPETETIISEVKKKYTKKDKFTFLDLGTGSGCIMLTILKQFPHAKGVGIDKSEKALRVAIENSKKLKLYSRCKLMKKDWKSKNFFKNISLLNKKFFKQDKFDLIISNPPYVSKEEMEELMDEVKYEPKIALYGGINGLSCYSFLFSKLKSIISDNGHIIFEINPKKVTDLKKIIFKNGFKNVSFVKDLSNKERLVVI